MHNKIIVKFITFCCTIILVIKDKRHVHQVCEKKRALITIMREVLSET